MPEDGFFDGNLKYTITLNDRNLNWFAGHGKQGIHFVGNYEQIQNVIKEKIVKTKTKPKTQKNKNTKTQKHKKTKT